MGSYIYIGTHVRAIEWAHSRPPHPPNPPNRGGVEKSPFESAAKRLEIDYIDLLIKINAMQTAN